MLYKRSAAVNCIIDNLSNFVYNPHAMISSFQLKYKHHFYLFLNESVLYVCFFELSIYGPEFSCSSFFPILYHISFVKTADMT